MINQVSNNKPSGYQSKECDSGIPISGRTADNGTYQILKLLPDGTLLSQQAIPAQYIGLPVPTALGGAGAVVPGVYMGIFLSILTIPANGVYDIEPFVQLDITGTAEVDLILTNVNSGLSTYSATRVPCVDPFDPTFLDFTTTDIGYYFDAVEMAPVNSSASQQRTFMQLLNAGTYHKVYLNAGDYNLIVVSRGTFTVNSPDALVGFNYINRYA